MAYRPVYPASGQAIASRRNNSTAIRPARVLLIVSALALAALVVAVTLAAAGVLVYRSDWILPGVRALGVELGGQFPAEAGRRLKTGWQWPDIQLAADRFELSAPPGSMGIQPDYDALIEQAYHQSRTGGRAYDLLHGDPRVTLPPRWTLDVDAARAFLEGLAPQVSVTPVNAGVVVVGGRVETIAASAGRELDVEATLADLELNLAGVIEGSRLALVTRPIPPAVSDVSAAVAQAEGILGSAPTIRAYDLVTDETIVWPVPVEEWAGWLWFETSAGDPGRLDWGLDQARIQAYLIARDQELETARYLDVEEGLAALLAGPVEPGWDVHLRVYHHALVHTVQAGETLASIGRAYGIPYPWIQAANPQLGELLSVGQTLTIPSPDEMLPLPPVMNQRIVVSISQQRMWVYEDGALKWEWSVSTGIESSPTAPGVFQVQTHEENAYAENWDLWMPYFMGIYRPVPTSQFMNGFHGFPTRNGWQLLWTTNLGRPVTYGCILVAQENAAALYKWAQEGAIVVIEP